MRHDSVQTADAGHLGNLTADQEKKLHQLWTQLLEAFEFDASELLHNEHEHEHGHEHEHEKASSQTPTSATAAKLEQQQQQQQQKTEEQDHKVATLKRSVTGKSNRSVTGAGAASVKSHNHSHSHGHGHGHGHQVEMDAHELRDAWLGMVKHEDPDALLLRFLRARKWDVAHAFNMLRGALIWRVKEVDVGRVLREGEPWCKARENKDKEQKGAHEYLQQLREGKVYMRGRDRQGRPVGYVHVASHKPGQQSQETIEKLIIQTIETARCLFTPPNESFCVVFDMTNFSLSNMEWQPVRFIIRAFEANYPECLGAMLIHNAPWIFSGVWKIIRGLLDPVVAAKVDFTRSVADLERHIARENIISRIGGDDAYTYTYIEPTISPSSSPTSTSGHHQQEDKDEEEEEEDVLLSPAHEAKRQEILADRREIAGRFLAATQAWIGHLDRHEMEDAAIHEKIRRNAIEALAANYWTLDPYIRSRTLMDRTGVLKPDGRVDLYPDRTKKEQQQEDADSAVGEKKTRGVGETAGVATAVRQEVVAVAG